jgi:hypothetical protein
MNFYQLEVKAFKKIIFEEEWKFVAILEKLINK